MIARLLAMLDRDPGRVLVAGLGLAALGVVTTLRTLADSAGQWSDALAVGDRVTLGLYFARPTHALPFLVGAFLVVLALRLGARVPLWLTGIVAGIAAAYVALGLVASVAAVYVSASGSLGEGAAAVELTTRQRTFGCAEALIGSLGFAVAALAALRALVGAPAPEPVVDLEDEDAFNQLDDLEELEEEPELAPGWVRVDPPEPYEAVEPVADNGRPPLPVPEQAPEPATEPPPQRLETPIERYRRIYDERLRFSPHSAEARALLARLHDDPGDGKAALALDRMAGDEVH